MPDFAAEALEAWKQRALAAERELGLAHGREEELTAQIRMVLEEAFYKPVVTGAIPGAAPRQPAPPAEPLPQGALDGDGEMGDEAELAEIGREHAAWAQAVLDRQSKQRGAEEG